jgi:hypothetical protein
MPGSTYCETEVVFNLGFRPQNVYLVEKNPATLANFTRRCVGKPVPPRENILRMLLSEAGTRLRSRGVRLDVAHLDFCENVESDKTMIAESRAFIRSGVFAERAMLAVTWQRGREHDVQRLASLGVTVQAV